VMDVEQLDIDAQLTDDTIQKYIQNATGAKSLMNIPEDAFMWAIKLGIGQLTTPVLKCVQDVYDELVTIVTQTVAKVPEFQQFPALKDRIVEASTGLVHRFVPDTNKLVTQLVEMELAYVNLENPNVQVKEIKKSERHEMLEGFLVKKGGDKWNMQRITKEAKFQRRWFVLKSKTLFYFADPESTKPLGLLPLDGCTVQMGTDYKMTEEEKAAQAAQRERDRARGKDVPEDPIDWTNPENLEFRITHRSGRVILHNRNELVLRGENKVEFDMWLEALRRACGMTVGDDSDTKRSDVAIIREVVLSYFRTVRMALYDSVPKAIMFSLVNPTKKLMEKELMVRVYDESLLDTIMAEDPQIHERRMRLKRMITLLREVQLILRDVSEGKI